MSKQKQTPAEGLILMLVNWIEYQNHSLLQTSFDKLRKKLVNERIKKLHKNNFESISSSSDKNSLETSLSNYVSISDFKPVLDNYTSVKIIDYETHGIKKDLQKIVANKIAFENSQIFNKQTFLQNWLIRDIADEVFVEDYPYSDYAQKKITSYHEDALSSVRKFTFTQYCKTNLKKKTSFLMFIEKDPLKYKKTMISSSLSYLEDSANQIALEIFQCLLRAGGQEQSPVHYLYEINQIIQMIYNQHDDLKEQAFLQVIKQITSKKEIYMRILCCLCYSIKPSTRMYIPLLNYLFEENNIYENIPSKIANYCFFHLIKNFDRQKKNPPSIFQLFCAFHNKKVPIIINFPKQKVFFIESYTTVEQFLAELIQYFNLDPNVDYLLELNSILMQKGPILDNFNKFCMVDEEDYKWSDYQNFKGLRAIIVLKNVNDINQSTRCHNIMYNYCANQYVRGLYSLKSKEIVMIAALKMHSEMNDEENYKLIFDNLVTKRKIRQLKSSEDQELYKKHILANYFKIKDRSKQQARKQILKILSRSRGFNTHFFRCDIFIEDFEEFNAWVGVQNDRFIIVEPLTGRIMRNILYTKIKEWGKSSSQLCMKVDEVGQLHIDSRQIDVLSSLYQNYINYHSKIIFS